MTTTNRVQSGVPTGGQFAPTTHAESDVELSAADIAEDDRPWSWETLTEEVGEAKAAELRERSGDSLGKAMALAIAEGPEQTWTPQADGSFTGRRNGHTITIEDVGDGAFRATIVTRRGGNVITFADTEAEVKASAVDVSNGIAGAEMRAAVHGSERSAGITDGHEWHEHPFEDVDYLDLHNNGHRITVDSGEPEVRWASVKTSADHEFKLYSEPGETRDDMRRRAVELSNDIAAAEREHVLEQRAAKDLFRGIDLETVEPPF